MTKKRGNGEGSVYYSESKKCWVGVFIVGIDENGKYKKKFVYRKTQREVNEALAKVKFDVHTGDYLDESQITIYQLGLQLLEDDYNQGIIKESSYRRNLETLKMMKSIYSTPLQKANTTLLKNYLLSLQNYSQSVINKSHMILKRVFREAVKRKIIKDSPMEEIKKPVSKQTKTKVRALTEEENSKLYWILMKEDVEYSEEFLISMKTGMRMGEILALDVRDINFIFNTISINKTISQGEKGKPFISDTPKTDAGNRQIKMLDDVKTILREAIGDRKSGTIFTKKDGSLISVNQVNMVFKRTLKKYNILDEYEIGKVSQHSLRHTFATRCIEAQMSPYSISKILGHSDISITMNTYCDAFAKYQSREIEKVDMYFKNLGMVSDSKAEIKIS